jgi:uncharacterized protein with HEPN domain
MKNDQVYLKQINDCVRKIRDFTTGMDYKQFAADEKTQSAVILQLTLIGELAKKISQKIRVRIDLPWKEITGFRDRAIHDYYQIDLRIVWQTVGDDLKILEKAVNKFLAL